MKNAPVEIALRIVLQRPPAGVDFGLQKGRGSAYETVQKQRSKGEDLEFNFTVTVKAGKADLPDFAGPMVQGPSGARFVYLDIGTYAGQTDTPWSRRMKIPLSVIDWAMIQNAAGGSQNTLETSVAGTGRDGGPACGTVKPAPRWNPK